MTNINSTLGELVTAQQAVGNSTMISLIGKSVDVPGNSIEHTEGNNTNLTYSLNAEATSVKVEIFDDAGNLVTTVNGTRRGRQQPGRMERTRQPGETGKLRILHI